MKKVSKMAIREVKGNISNLNQQKEEIRLNAAKHIQSIKETLEATYLKLAISLEQAHRDIIPMLITILERLKSFEDTLLQAARTASAVLHDGSKKQICVSYKNAGENM